jgi:hypothetical protein
MREPDSHELAESIIAALRTMPSPEIASQTETKEPDPGVLRRDRLWLAQGLAWLRYCLRLSRLRLTVPIALLVGTILSLVNQGGMLMAGQIDVRMCVICGLNFLLPLVALNILLVAAASIVRDRGGSERSP